MGALLILVILALAVIAAGVLAYSSNGPTRAVNARQKVAEAQAEALESRAEARVSIRALRSIANGAGNPVLEAQVALDEIENNNNREISQ